MSTERKVKNDQIEDIYPLTPMQEGLLYESLVQRDRDDHPYVIQSRYDISANLQVEHFRNSWQKIVGRHQLLRTAFAYEKVKKPVQVVLRHRPVPFKLIEIDTVPDETTDLIAIRDLKKGFDLQKDPLMRITLIRMADGNYHMIWTHHHIIMDGWSLSIIERELFELYHAAISNRQDSLPPAVPVRNYINWLQSKERNESVDFWSDFLEGFEKITPITIRKVSGLKGKKNTLSKNFTLPDDLRDKMHLVAGNSGVTLSTLMQTVWGILLSVYNNSDDVLFGSVVSGRPPHLAGSQEMVGVFINVIPVRLRLNPDQALKELISGMQSFFIDSQDYHDAPLAEVMSRIERRELFDHLVTFENHPANTDGNADEIGISINPYEAHDITHYPFGLKITALKKIHLQYSWNTDLFHEKRIASIHSHYETLLYKVTEDLEQSVRSLSPLSENERSEMLRFSKGPELSIEEVPDFLEMFWNQVQLNGESVACKDSEKALSYTELDLKSNQLAQFLTKQNVKPESRIAVEMDRNVDLIVSILAILKMNCSYVPIDPELPEERKNELKSSAKVSFTISQNIHDLSSNMIMHSEFIKLSVNTVTEAYLIFTSGSTGKSKGVMISRSSLSHYIQSIKETLFQEGGGNMALFSSVAFDMTITPLFAPLATGKTLFLFEQHTPPHLALKKIFASGMGIDTVKMTPSHIDLIESLQIKKTDVKQIIAGGEALLDRHTKTIRKISKSIPIFNEYGPTEATVGSSVSKITDNSPRISIGKPMAGTVLYVLDRYRHLLPIGSAGELYIGGKGLSMGYLDRPELTNEKFVSIDSLPESPLLYQTGDLVRWNESGDLEYIGRMDQQVKIRGHRVEPGEIEGVLKENPLVKHAFVKAIYNHDEISLAAYYICKKDSTSAKLKERLLTYLQKKLPKVMVPQHLIQIYEVPLNSNGKVDYDQLPDIRELNGEGEKLQYWIRQFNQDPQNETGISKAGIHSTGLLSDFEREQLLKWNATEKEFPGHSTLVDLFESRVSTSPESTALLCEDTGSDGQTLSMSYRELNSRANRLAHYLMKHHSVTPETIVGICIERTPSMVVGLLGILKAGGAYLPLDPQYPADRLAYMIADSGVDVILTQKDILPGLEAVDAVQDDQKDKPMATVCLDSPELFDDYSEDNPVRQASPDELAYVIYTSGSTGKPKGVMIEHRGVLNWLLAYMDAMQITGESRSLQVASLSFDASVHEIFSTLLAGAELFLIPKKALINRHLSEFMNNHKITHVFIPPSLLAAVPEYPLPHLKAITVGGETCPATLVDTWGKNRLFINGYGPTEITVCATLGICTPGSGKPTIGKPVQNVQVHILDANNRLQPVGVPGELCIAGAGLARGYLNREELTREKFIEAEIFGRRIRLYRSGDLARWLDDGTIDFMGRIDDQVKLRGFRIEPGEIASAIMQHPDVIDAVVMVRNKDRDPYLAAYLTVNTNMLAADTSAEPVFSDRDENVTIIHSPHAEQLLKEVQNILIGTLPDYMIPATMSVLNIIPLTVSGKVDYHLLSRLTGSLQPSESEKPKNELEKQLQEIWSEVLNVQIISVHDHFFRIGGHSLKAMQVVNRIGNKLKIKVELSELNQEPTIRGLAERISKKEKGAGTDIPKAADQNEYPLSYAQQRLWLLHNMDAESAYNMPLTYKIGEQIDVSSLKKAFKQLIQRHEILRTAFVLINGEPRQKIVEVADIEITLKDLTDADTPIMAARLFCEKQALIPFDLSLPPLLRCILIKTDEQEYILQLCIHHIVGDGWSTRVLFNELITLYESYKFGHKNTLAENRVQYRDFTIWQLNKDLSDDRTFWLNYMESASEKVYLPYDRSPLTKRKFIGRYISTTLEKEIFSGLKKISSHRETTPSTVLLSLFSLLLFKLTGQNDFPIAISSAGRNNRDLEQMIGFFVNILPLRVQINDQMDFDELLDTVIQSSEKIYSHQEYPFNKLVEDLNPDRAGFGQPLSNVVFGYQNYADVHLDSDSGAQSSLQEAEGFELQNNTAKFDITLFAFEKGSELQLDIEYDSELFDEKTIQNYLDTLKSFAKMITSEIE